MDAEGTPAARRDGALQRCLGAVVLLALVGATLCGWLLGDAGWLLGRLGQSGGTLFRLVLGTAAFLALTAVGSGLLGIIGAGRGAPATAVAACFLLAGLCAGSLIFVGVVAL